MVSNAETYKQVNVRIKRDMYSLLKARSEDECMDVTTFVRRCILKELRQLPKLN